MTPLLIVQQLTDRLHDAEIRYCHWKSNEHVDAAVLGKTDLDVLVDHTQKTPLRQILKEVGFKYFEAIPCRRYVDIDDYLAIDAATGTLVHLHLHYTLELGEKQLKGYHLPWEELILSSRLYDSEHHIYISEPNIEILLLIVRAALKVRTRDRLKTLLKHDYFKGDFIREFRWLKARIGIKQVRHLSETLLGSEASQLVNDVIQSEAQLPQILQPGNPIYRSLQTYRRYSPSTARVLRWRREFQNLRYRVLRKYFQAPVTTRRTPIQGGLIVAILGADGSGKSTVTSEIVKCLSQKLDVMPVYLGSGDGTASLLRLPLIWATRTAKIRKKSAKNKPSEQSNGGDSSGTQSRSNRERPKSKLSSLVKILWATSLVYEKQNKLKQSCTAKDRGMIVITDRYPQSQILGFNDGPLLSPETASNETSKNFPKPLQQWEFDNYQQMATAMPPDLVIKLNVTPEVALARKPESPAETVCKKVAAIEALQFPSQTTVINIDATQPLSEVLLKAKWAVWESL